MTRKTKHNRTDILKLIGEISVYSQTKLMCKLNPDEYAKLFKMKITEVNTGDIKLETIDIGNAIKRKWNWSSPVPEPHCKLLVETIF